MYIQGILSLMGVLTCFPNIIFYACPTLIIFRQKDLEKSLLVLGKCENQNLLFLELCLIFFLFMVLPTFLSSILSDIQPILLCSMKSQKLEQHLE